MAYITPMQDPSQGPSWLRNPDPLGILAREAARQQQRRFNPTGLGQMGPLRDPLWDAFFQSMDDAGVDRTVGGASPENSQQLRGLTSRTAYNRYGFSQMPSRTVPQASGIFTGIPSAGASNPLYINGAMRGLQQAGNPTEDYQSHQGWMESDPAAQGYWEGRRRSTKQGTTGQSRLRIVGQRGGPRA